MTSVLNVDTIADKAGSGPVGLTKQSAAKVLFGMNLNSSTYMDVANNTLCSMTLNISSGTDAGTGLARGNITNAMASKQYICSSDIYAANHTQNPDVGVSTTSLIATQQHNAEDKSDLDAYGWTKIHGDLA